MLRKDLIITIDGPSGAGKSTVAKMLARVLNYTYIDTGAMYRGVAYAFMKEKNPVEIDRFLRNLTIKFELKEETRVYLDGEDISEHIRSPEVSLFASQLSQNTKIREHLRVLQREAGKSGGVVLEGRDTGSVVFPDAHIKFYLDADLKERAMRRYLELVSRGINSELDNVQEEILKRDRNDSERDIAPLIVPDGAIYIDTTGIDAASVVERLQEIVRNCLLGG